MSRFFRCISGLSLFRQISDFERRVSRMENDAKAFHRAVGSIGKALDD